MAENPAQSTPFRPLCPKCSTQHWPAETCPAFGKAKQPLPDEIAANNAGLEAEAKFEARYPRKPKENA